MSDLISRQAAIDAVRNMWGIVSPISDDILLIDKAQAETELMMLPTAEPRKGKWEVCNILDYAQRPSGRKILRCPFCGYLTDEFRSMVDYYHKLTHFCPNCGARMEESDERTD